MISYLSKKQSNKLIFLCWLAYTTAYLGRLNYSANLVCIVEEMGITKAEGGLVASCFFFAYCAGQLFHGFMNRLYNPRYMIAISLVGSSLINLLFPFCNGIVLMAGLWLLNGFLQAILWTTLCRTLSRYLDDSSMKKSILVMGTTTSVGTVLIYGISALFTEILNWKYTFLLAFVVLFFVGVIWFFGFHSLTCDIPERQTKVQLHQIGKHKMSRVFILLLSMICLFGVMDNLIRDGLTTWSPSIFYEVHHLPNSMSILLTLGLPLLATLGSFICVSVHRYIRDYIKLCTIFFIGAAISILVMVLCLPLNMWFITVLCFAVSALMMAVINNCVTSIVPMELRDMADSGATAGVTNTFCYLGSTLSTYILGSIVDRTGSWNGVFYFMIGVCASAVIICLVYIMLHTKIAVDKKRKI